MVPGRNNAEIPGRRKLLAADDGGQGTDGKVENQPELFVGKRVCTT